MRPLGNEVELAELTHRLLTTPQLRQLGYTPRQIRYRVATKNLLPILNGVYCLDQSHDGFLTKAIAVCLRYPGSFLSGAAGTRYWGFRKGMPDHYEFTVPEGCRPRGIDFVQFHFSNRTEGIDVRDNLDGLRVSSPERTAFDAAARLDEFGLRSLIHDAIHQRKVTSESLAEVGERLCGAGRRGTRLFRLVLDTARTAEAVHSEEELLLLDALRAAGLTDAVPQCPVKLPNGGTIHLDIGIPSAMVGTEVDGPTHEDPIAMHRDKSRDLQAAVQGWQVLRIPTEDVRHRLRVVTSYVVAICRRRTALAR